MQTLIDRIAALPQDDSARWMQKIYLFNAILAEKSQVVVEIGTHRGATSLMLALALYENGSGHLYTCDPTDYGFVQTLRQFPELAPHVTYTQKRAVELEVVDIDLLFVDGFHEKAAVAEEIKYFLPRLSYGAIVLFHDAGGDNEMVGVNAAIEEAGLRTEPVVIEGAVMRLYTHLPL